MNKHIKRLRAIITEKNKTFAAIVETWVYLTDDPKTIAIIDVDDAHDIAIDDMWPFEVKVDISFGSISHLIKWVINDKYWKDIEAGTKHLPEGWHDGTKIYSRI